MAGRNPKPKPIIRMRALNLFALELNENGHLEYKSAGHRFEIMKEGSEEWEPLEIDAKIIEPEKTEDLTVTS
jgi:hypothetical protein